MPDEFWSMTFAEVDIYCKGYETRMARLKEVPRLVAAILLNINRRKNTPAVKVEDVFPLYTDKVTRDLMSKEEFEQAKNLRNRVIKWKTRN